jgi:large subunit ribosomal protein L17
MPHQIHQRKFGRKSDLRRSLVRNLTLSVLRYERVKTTEAKAKEIRGFVDRMINLGKDGGLEARREAMAWLPEAAIVEKVFNDLPQRYADRTSGYLRITRLARRVGDHSKLMLVELMPGVDEVGKAPATEEKPRRRRLSLRRGRNDAKDAPASSAAEEPANAAKAPAKKPSTATRKKTPAKASSKED